MRDPSPFSLGLILRGRAYGRRTPRSDLDVALAAAALDFRLDLFFLGESVLQLVTDRETEESMLPAGYRAWASLPQLADVRVFAESGWLEDCARRGLQIGVPVNAMTARAMSDTWRRCAQVLVL
jgi:sulfur relay (sulfurtransferase) DsrF/TusC family protein